MFPQEAGEVLEKLLPPTHTHFKQYTQSTHSTHTQYIVAAVAFCFSKSQCRVVLQSVLWMKSTVLRYGIVL